MDNHQVNIPEDRLTGGGRSGLTTEERGRLKSLERKNRELHQASETLRKASAYFAQSELDRRFKP